MTSTDMIAELTVETPVNAPPADVWAALTSDLGAWWPAEFYIGGAEGSTIRLEARPGGQMIEEWANGGGLQWAQVWTVIPNELLQTTGLTFPEWGGPAVGFVTWKIEATDEGSTLRLTEHTFGRSTDENRAETDKGWNFLHQCLKSHLEATEPPRWEG